jgi:hypothetical protein
MIWVYGIPRHAASRPSSWRQTAPPSIVGMQIPIDIMVTVGAGNLFCCDNSRKIIWKGPWKFLVIDQEPEHLT